MDSSEGLVRPAMVCGVSRLSEAKSLQYVSSDIKELRSFARGLRKDIDAVENAVASYLSNGFVERTNNKLKMVKRSMYNRCGIKLLRAKLTLNRARE